MAWGSVLVILLMYAGLGLILIVPFILSAQKTLRQVAPHNRRLQPVQLWWWLMPIPIVSHIIIFILVLRLAQSLHAEYKERGIPASNAPTLVAGMAQWGVSVLMILAGGRKVGLFAVGLALFFVYWTSVATVRRKLEETPKEIPNTNI
ncbi:MAG: hypothetical protein BGO70_06925 [Bacteroidetes bacterium 43-93]|nr:hypothetical protein [Bacteroidota bacterium]OJW97515.1 MAG: hypothetical protein BGO70_06925 [Bacteroidetes bacterium 43-93]